MISVGTGLEKSSYSLQYSHARLQRRIGIIWASRGWSVGASDRTSMHRDGPGTALVFSGGEKGNQAEQGVGSSNQTNQATLFEAIAGEELGCIRVAHFRQFGFDFSADRSRRGIGARSNFDQSVLGHCLFKVVSQICAFTHIKHIKDRLLAQKHEAAKAFLVLWRHFHLTKGPLRSQMRVRSLNQVELFFEFRIAHFL